MDTNILGRKSERSSTIHFLFFLSEVFALRDSTVEKCVQMKARKGGGCKEKGREREREKERERKRERERERVRDIDV